MTFQEEDCTSTCREQDWTSGPGGVAWFVEVPLHRDIRHPYELPGGSSSDASPLPGGGARSAVLRLFRWGPGTRWIAGGQDVLRDVHCATPVVSYKFLAGIGATSGSGAEPGLPPHACHRRLPKTMRLIGFRAKRRRSRS